MIRVRPHLYHQKKSWAKRIVTLMAASPKAAAPIEGRDNHGQIYDDRPLPNGIEYQGFAHVEVQSVIASPPNPSAAGPRSSEDNEFVLKTRAVPPHLVARYLQQGWWTDETLGDVVARGLAATPDNEFRIHSEVRPYTATFSDVERMARRLAGGLRARGVASGDAVAFQLPNWVEAAATFWASALLGAAVVPIVHFYGPQEVGYILTSARPKVFITAEGFGRMTFRPDVCVDVPVVAVVGRDFDELLEAEPMMGTLPVDPDSPALIAYTSGTTNAPKGVIHSHRTLLAEVRQLTEQGYDSQKPLTAAPVGHFAGMESGLLIPLLGQQGHQFDRRVGRQ